MATTTNQVREQIRSRLESLRAENGYQADIRVVLNPADARDKKQHPTTGLYGVLWTEPAKALESKPGAILWDQPFAIDIPVTWEAGAEVRMDAIRAELAGALLQRLQGVRKQELSEFVTQYPQGGNSGVVSVVIATQYVENV